MTYALQARWVIPIDRPPIAGGIVSVAEGRIVAVGENLSGRPPTDLGDVALLPGFINAHTHLEFSLLERPLGEPGMPFPQWIGKVIAHRQSLLARFAEQPEEVARMRSEAVARGLADCDGYGVAAIGEISTRRLTDADLGTVFAAPHCTAFLELLGLAPIRAPALLELAREYLAERMISLVRGLSPHAPYTIGLPLLADLCALSRDAQCPLAMHLAESREELELLDSQRGSFVNLLDSIGAWHPQSIPPGTRPLDYLRILASAHRALVIHGNYLTEDELAFVAARRERMSVVYCPRTHAYFGHEHYPLRQMLDAGARVAVGTDSRASNPDLSVLAELRHIGLHHRGLSPDEIIRLGTLAGAEALGIDADFGTIGVGKRAVFAMVEMDHESDDPCELVIGGEGRVAVHPDLIPPELNAERWF